MSKFTDPTSNEDTVLVLGATGKTGRRIVSTLSTKGLAVRPGSRSASPSFDWKNSANWAECLQGVSKVYLNYAPDLAMPGATDAIIELLAQARQQDVERVVLLSGRGEQEAQACEQLVQESGLEWAIVRASWFNQNFSEGALIDMVRSGVITLPAGDTLEPFVDVDDIADVAVAALTEDGHSGNVYEVTGPRLMTMADIAAELSAAIGREIRFIDVPHEAFIKQLRESGAPRRCRLDARLFVRHGA
jgi:uncharacterized protein YbjT (DUF2867 family)